MYMREGKAFKNYDSAKSKEFFSSENIFFRQRQRTNVCYIFKNLTVTIVNVSVDEDVFVLCTGDGGDELVSFTIIKDQGYIYGVCRYMAFFSLGLPKSSDYIKKVL